MKLSRVNNLLLVLIILIDGYIVVAPLLPNLFFNIQQHQGKRQALQKLIQPGSKTAPSGPQPNQVIIPSMLLDQPVLEGTVANQYKTLDKGIWRWPGSSTPDKGGNTVLIGHRFTYTNPRGVFYFLNKVKVGDELGIVWNNKKYEYKVATVNEVSPKDTTIEDATAQPELTLFTCTPLWLPKDRLVVVADLEAHP